MPCEIIHDTMDLEAETLEAIMPDPANPETIGTCYPFPLLRRTGRKSVMSFRTVSLRNDFTQVTFALDLGGRIISWYDRRTDSEIIPLPTGIELAAGGCRGVKWDHGVFVNIMGSKPGELGPIEFLIREPDSDEEPAELLLHEIIPGQGFGILQTWTLSPDDACLDLQVRVQVRGMEPTYASTGLDMPTGALGKISQDRSMLRKDNENRGLVALHRPETFEHGKFRRVEYDLVQGHTVDTWSATLIPYSGVENVIWATRDAVLGLQDSKATVQTTRPIQAPTLFVLNSQGNTFEAKFEADLLRPETLDTSGVPYGVRGLAVRDGNKGSYIEWRHDSSASGDFDPSDRDAGSRHLYHFRRALTALELKDFETADQCLEESLLFNGDDPLTWWLKAVVRRLAEGADGDRPELLNAHYLNPLEPALRAESFLQQNEQGHEPSPILKPLVQNPDALLDVICLLIESHLVEEATRLMDEALRHREQPMVRLLQAWLLLRDTRMKVEAAGHVEKAEQQPWEPPFPWREIEKQAIRDLHMTFPSYPILRKRYQLTTSS